MCFMLPKTFLIVIVCVAAIQRKDVAIDPGTNDSETSGTSQGKWKTWVEECDSTVLMQYRSAIDQCIGFDIERLCTPRGWKQWNSSSLTMHSSEAAFARQSPVRPTPGDRILLLPVVPAFSGSTALESIFMSSRSISTLCNAKTFQCEGYQIPGVENGNMLEKWAQFWDLTNPVLLDKGPRDLAAYTSNPDGSPVEFTLETIVEDIADANSRMADVAPTLHKANIFRLVDVYVILWRPICLVHLSSSSRKIMSKWGGNGENFASSVVGQMHAYQYLSSLGKSVLVINLGDLLWRPERNRLRLQAFLPSIGNLDIDYLPTIGKDFNRCNQFKVSSSVKQFGNTIDAERDCGYNVTDGNCLAGSEHDLVQHLTPNLQSQYLDAHALLNGLS